MNCSDDSDILPISFEINVLVDGLETLSSSSLNIDANTTSTAKPYEVYLLPLGRFRRSK